MFTLYIITFYLKFLSPTVKVERNKSKIDNIKIIINLLTGLKSYLKRYLKRKQSLKTATYRQNKQKIRRRKGIPQVPPLKELRASRLSYLITNVGRKLAKILTVRHKTHHPIETFLHLTVLVGRNQEGERYPYYTKFTQQTIIDIAKRTFDIEHGTLLHQFISHLQSSVSLL